MDECHVLLCKDKMVSPSEWVNAIKNEGFDLNFDTSYDMANETVFGYQPCTWHGKDVGFELSYVERSDDPEWFEEWEEYLKGASQYDFCVSFGIRDESPAILIAGAVLAKVTDGV